MQVFKRCQRVGKGDVCRAIGGKGRVEVHFWCGFSDLPVDECYGALSTVNVAIEQPALCSQAVACKARPAYHQWAARVESFKENHASPIIGDLS